MSNVAYGKRKKWAITFRKVLNYAYTRLKGKKSITSHTFIAYPAIQTKEELAEAILRLAWAVPKASEGEVIIPCKQGLENTSLEHLAFPPYLEALPKDELAHVRLIASTEMNGELAKSHVLLLKASTLLNPKLWFRWGRTVMLDPYWYSTTESIHLHRLVHDKLGQHTDQYKSFSLNNFNRLLQTHQGKQKAYCFVTGPSFDRYEEFTYEPDAFKVICNSIVKNDAFLEYIGGPDLLVFADPVFHFGPSAYAAAFRKEMLKVAEKYGCFVVVPDHTLPLMKGHFPQLKDQLIGMPHFPTYNIPSPGSFGVRGSGNILTWLMLPLASAVAKEVCIIGADGRKKEEKYFWKHSKSAQFDDLMQAAFDAHPSFFRDRDYADYYDEHCQFLEELLQYGEAEGVQYRSLTESYIPALVKRQG